MKAVIGFLFVLAALSMSACSVAVGVTPEGAKDVQIAQTGVSRDVVIAEFGLPVLSDRQAVEGPPPAIRSPLRSRSALQAKASATPLHRTEAFDVFMVPSKAATRRGGDDPGLERIRVFYDDNNVVTRAEALDSEGQWKPVDQVFAL